MNATELVAYDQAKQTFLAMGRPDNIPTHILSGLSAGLAATLLGSPVDVVKTRVMAAKAPAAPIPGGPAHVPEFNGPIDCAMKLLKEQGPLAFYKGFIPSVAVFLFGSTACGKRGCLSIWMHCSLIGFPAPCPPCPFSVFFPSPLRTHSNFARIGSWNVITWMTLEQLKKLYFEHQENQPKRL